MTHRQTHNGVAKEGLGSEGGGANGSDGGDGTRTYRMDFPARAVPMPCPVEGCSDRASMRTAMRVQFLQRHVRDTMVILEEGNLPQTRYPLCDMLVLWKALNGTYRLTSQCNQGAERKRRRLTAEEEREVTVRAFRAYAPPLEMANSFIYLGRGVTTHVSNPKSINACTMALENNPDTRGSAPSLLRMRPILFQTSLARDNFLTTASQSSSSA